MAASEPQEQLARDRRKYERLLLARLGRSLSKEDAEDIVSESLIRAQLKLVEDPPRRGHEGAWFSRIVLNLGIDFLRARDGRRSNSVSHRSRTVPLTDLDEGSRDLASGDMDETAELVEFAEDVERAQTEELVRRVMSTLDPKDAELVKLRHLVGPAATREQVARMAGLTVGEFRWRYARAWRHFVEAVALDAPTERCARTRQLLGELEAGTAPAEVSSEIDAHTLDCASCRVFARESYRALETLPFVPVVGVAERWSARIACWWERSGPEASAGAGTAATGAGLWALLTGGGSVGLLKVVAIVCSATAVTAGVCAGVIAVVDEWPEQHQPQSSQAKRHEPRATPRPEPTAVATPPPRSLPSPTPAPARRPRDRRAEHPATSGTADLSGDKQIPASASDDASEFDPGASSASNEPAPATTAGGGEFSP